MENSVEDSGLQQIIRNEFTKLALMGIQALQFQDFRQIMVSGSGLGHTGFTVYEGKRINGLNSAHTV